MWHLQLNRGLITGLAIRAAIFLGGCLLAHIGSEPVRLDQATAGLSPAVQIVRSVPR